MIYADKNKLNKKYMCRLLKCYRQNRTQMTDLHFSWQAQIRLKTGGQVNYACPEAFYRGFAQIKLFIIKLSRTHRL